jgi:hypothetical protein
MLEQQVGKGRRASIGLQAHQQLRLCYGRQRRVPRLQQAQKNLRGARVPGVCDGGAKGRERSLGEEAEVGVVRNVGEDAFRRGRVLLWEAGMWGDEQT